MAAVSVRLQCEHGHNNAHIGRKIPQWKTGLDDILTAWARRCASSCSWRDLVLETPTPLDSSVQRLVLVEASDPVSKAWFPSDAESTYLSPIEPPPSYYDSITDETPSYDFAEESASVEPAYKQQNPPPAYDYVPKRRFQESMTAPGIDFDNTSSFRQVAGKKAKKAQQQAQQSKWADNGEEGNKDGGQGDGDGNGNGNGGEGGGSNNGDGGAGEGGGGGDDWNDTGNKKKKGTKAKEEERKKQEEEEKNKEDEAANGNNALSWADDANGDLGDDWGGFTTTTAKKDKKGKKGKLDPVPEKANFDDINLNDDAPKLDLDFGSTEKKENGFGFGEWGGAAGGGNSGWGAGNSWSFGNQTATTDIADSLSRAATTDTADTGSSWSFGVNKKNKKKTTPTSGFDFGDFGALDEGKEPEAKADDIHDTVDDDIHDTVDDDLDTGFTAAGRGKKDKKKSIFADTEADLGTIGTAIAEAEAAADDGWAGGWGAASTKKKKGKKTEEEAPLPLPPPPPPVVPADTSATDEWGGFGTKKSKKGGKKITEVEEPAIVAVPDPEPEADVSWGSLGKKDKKKGGKKETDKVDEPAITVVLDPEPELDFGWGSTKKSKKPDPEPEPEVDAGWGLFGKKKKGAKKDADKIEEPVVTKEPKPEPKLHDWSTFGAEEDDTKKKKKSIWDEPEKEEKKPIVEEAPEPDITANTGWGTFGSKKDKGKKVKKEILDEFQSPPQDPEQYAEDKPSLSRTGSKKDKKGKKALVSEVKDDPLPVTDSKAAADAAASVGVDDDWMSGWGSTDKKKNDKKNKRNSLASSKADDGPPGPPTIPAVPDIPNASSFDIWGTLSKKDKDKKGKKGKTIEAESEIPAFEDPAPVEVNSEDEFLASLVGVPAKEKKKREKEREKLKKEREKELAEADPDSFAFQDPAPVEVDSEDEFLASLVGLSAKDKKKREKEREKLKKEREKESVEAEPDGIAFRDPALVGVDSEDEFLASLVGLSAKDKKKKEKEREKMKKEREKEFVGAEPESLAFEDLAPVEVNSEDEFAASLVGLSLKEKKKREKEREKVKQEEKENTVFEAPVEVNSEDEFVASLADLSPRDKKKKEREREKVKLGREREREEREKLEREEEERKEEDEKAAKEKEEEKAAKAKEKSTVKGKLGKKGKTSTSPEVSKTKDLLTGSVPDIAPTAEADSWGTWDTSKKDKKGVNKDMEFDAPPPAPTPPAQGLTPEPEEEEDAWASFAPAKSTKGKKDAKKDAKVDDVKAGKKGMKDKSDELIEEEKPAKDDSKKKASTKEETPAKATKSFWGGIGTTSSSKAKTSKVEEKAKKEAEAEAEAEADLDPDEIVGILDEPARKSSKDKIGSKLSKTTTKDSKFGDAKKSIADDDVLTGKGKDGKSTKGLDKDDDQKEDAPASSLWGSSSKKTSGKKGDEARNKIGKADEANGKGSVKTGAWNDPEPTEDDQAEAAQPSKPSKTAMLTPKSTTKSSSVLQRVKELEKNRAAAAAEPLPPPPPADPEPILKADRKGASSKSKDPPSTKSKKKDSSPEVVDNKQGAKDSVPGSFPGEFEGMDDDFGDLMETSPVEKKETKDSKKSSKSAKEAKVSSKALDTPESQRPPTPPPEPKEEKPAKKERPRVAKTGGASSWGMWGASAPAKDKRESKPKDDADVSPTPKKEKAAPPGLSRSRSTRTAKEKDKETVKSDAKSSDSDKPKKTESRPPKSRGSSFGAFFGGTPARTKSVRRPSTATSGPKLGSRRPSMDVDATGLPSPPAEDAPEVTGKAAKLLGSKSGKLDRKASTKGKQKTSAAAPDPYAIDSDDMVVVNGLADPIINAPISKKGKENGSKSKSREVEPELIAPVQKELPDRTRLKRVSKMDSSKPKLQSRAFNEDEDVVMVDAGPSDGPDDMQFITKPKGLQRSATSSKKPESKIGGLFGAFRKNRRTSDSGDRSRSKDIIEDVVTPRKRTVTGGDDFAKRPRRDDRRRSGKTTSRAAEGFVYDTAGDVAGATEADDVDAPREERRTKRADKDGTAKEARDEALRYEAERRSKRRAADKDKLKEESERKSRKAAEAETKQQEEKDARRAARRAREDEQANRELEEDILKPRSKRRDTADKEAERSSRPAKSDRRRSHYDKPPATQAPDEEEARRQRHEERRAKADRRKSAVPVEDYFDPRNGKHANDPYGGGGNDHTASWVESLAKESPGPPPLEPTIMEPAPDLRANGADDLAAEEDLRRSSHRKSKRASRMYADAPAADDQDDRRRRRREGVRSGEGSAEEERLRSPRRQSTLAGVNLGAGTKTFDGKTGQGKRSSWFQKIGGRM